MLSFLKKSPPSVIALLLQLTAFALSAFTTQVLSLQLAPIFFSLLCGAFAAALSRLIGLASWWLMIQFAFAPALVLMLALDIPPVLFLIAFILMLVV